MKTPLWNELINNPGKDVHEKDDNRVMEFMLQAGLSHQDVIDQFKNCVKGATFFMVANHPTHCVILIYAKCDRKEDTGYIASCLSKREHSPLDVMMKVANLTTHFAANCTVVTMESIPIHGSGMN